MAAVLLASTFSVHEFPPPPPPPPVSGRRCVWYCRSACPWNTCRSRVRRVFSLSPHETRTNRKGRGCRGAHDIPPRSPIFRFYLRITINCKCYNTSNTIYKFRNMRKYYLLLTIVERFLVGDFKNYTLHRHELFLRLSLGVSYCARGSHCNYFRVNGFSFQTSFIIRKI